MKVSAGNTGYVKPLVVARQILLPGSNLPFRTARCTACKPSALGCRSSAPCSSSSSTSAKTRRNQVLHPKRCRDGQNQLHYAWLQARLWLPFHALRLGIAKYIEIQLHVIRYEPEFPLSLCLQELSMLRPSAKAH